MKAYRDASSSTSTSSSSFTAPGAEAAVSNQEAMANIPGVETVAIDPMSFDNPGFVTLPPELFVMILRSPPTSGAVCDLTGGGSVDPAADWVKIDAGGPVWVNISNLSPAHRAALIPALEGANGVFTLSPEGRLTMGAASSEVFIGADGQ